MFIYPGQFNQFSINWLVKLIYIKKLKSGYMVPIYGYAPYKLASGRMEIKMWLLKFIVLKANDSM